MTFKNGMWPVHPGEALRGEVLRDEYLKPLGLSANALAKALRLSASRIGDIILERRGVSSVRPRIWTPLNVRLRTRAAIEPLDTPNPVATSRSAA